MNKIIKEFNERKYKDLEAVHRVLSTGSPRFGASIDSVIYEQEEIMNNCSSFIYYYMLIEMAIKNLKEYKDDKETLEGINENIKEYYEMYTLAAYKIKEFK